MYFNFKFPFYQFFQLTIYFKSLFKPKLGSTVIGIIKAYDVKLLH